VLIRKPDRVGDRAYRKVSRKEFEKKRNKRVGRLQACTGAKVEKVTMGAQEES